MVDGIIELLMGGSPMVAFAVYLIWSNSRSEKKLDQLSADFGARLDRLTAENKAEVNALRDRYEKREDEQRDRWQNVVSHIQTDRDNMERELVRVGQTTQENAQNTATQVQTFGQNLTQIDNKLTLIGEKVNQIDARTIQISERFRGLK